MTVTSSTNHVISWDNPRGTMAGKKDFGNDAVVVFEDQQRINMFAKKNTTMNDIKEQIADKEKQLRNIEDASDELMLIDDDQRIPYEVGEIFVLVTVEEAQKKLDEQKTEIESELLYLRTQASEIEDILMKVKSQLYAKFGDNINLEQPDS